MKIKFMVILLVFFQYISFSQSIYTGSFKTIKSTFFENDIEKYISYDPIIFTINIDAKTNTGTIKQYHPNIDKSYKYIITSLIKSDYDESKSILVTSYKGTWSHETFNSNESFTIYIFVKYDANQIELIIENKLKNNGTIYSLNKL